MQLKNSRGFDNLTAMHKMYKIVPLTQSEEQDFRYWLKISPAEKLDALQHLREIVYDIKHESRKRLQRVLKITQRKKS
jgi:cyanophycinase-like exopeptidase